MTKEELRAVRAYIDALEARLFNAQMLALGLGGILFGTLVAIMVHS